MHPFAPLVTFLCLEGKRRDRTGFESRESDRFAGLFTIAIGAIVDAPERFVDLGDQLALAITCAEFQSAIGFARGVPGLPG